MLKGAAKALLTVVGIFLILPALLFVVAISVQEGCLLCFEGEGRGGTAELVTNLALGAVIIWVIVFLYDVASNRRKVGISLARWALG